MTKSLPSGYPHDDLPACAFWELPEVIEVGPLGDRMRAWQSNRCASCGETDLRMVTDHDHETAKVRGMLCVRCNHHEASNWSHPAMVAYREGMNPATIVGHDEVYWSSWGGYARPQPRPTEEEAQAERAHLAEVISYAFRHFP